MKVRVKKRSGGTEQFDTQKIRKVVTKAGLNEEDTEKLITRLIKWANNKNKPLVTTFQIRKYVSSEMKNLDRKASQAYLDHEEIVDKTSK